MKGYEHYLTTEKKASANTLSSYLRDVGQYIHWLEGEGLPPEMAVQEDAERYVKYLSGKGKSVATVTRSLASLKSFYTYLMGEGLVAVNPARGITPAKVERKLPQILTNKEVDLFLEQPDPSDAKGCRDKAMLELLYATGIRVSELIGLDLDHVNLSVGFIRCSSRNKERIIPIYPAAVRALADYIDHVRPQMIEHPDERALFVHMSAHRITRQRLWAIPTPLLRGPSAGERGRPALHPGDAGPRRHLLHPNLRPAGEPEAEGRVHKGPSQGIKWTRSGPQGRFYPPSNMALPEQMLREGHVSCWLGISRAGGGAACPAARRKRPPAGPERGGAPRVQR